MAGRTMRVAARSPGILVALGALVVVASLVAGGVLALIAQRRPAEEVDRFARVPVGCEARVGFTVPGTYFVYEEVAAGVAPLSGCEPAADPAASFEVTVGVVDDGSGIDAGVIAVDEPTLVYDLDQRAGVPELMIVIGTPGDLTVTVAGSDPGVVAAVGRDPYRGVGDLRRVALVVVAVGLVVGGVLLAVSSRRSSPATVLVAPMAGAGAETWKPPSGPAISMAPPGRFRGDASP